MAHRAGRIQCAKGFYLACGPIPSTQPSTACLQGSQCLWRPCLLRPALVVVGVGTGLGQIQSIAYPVPSQVSTPHPAKLGQVSTPRPCSSSPK